LTVFFIKVLAIFTAASAFPFELPFLNKCHDTNRGRENRKLTVKKHHDKRARDLPKLKEGQSVFFEQKENENWKLGQIIDQYNPR
jgi:hypothetical protein